MIRSAFVTAGTPEHTLLLDELCEALDAAGIDARAEGGRLLVDGGTLAVRLVDRAHPTPAEIVELVGGVAAAAPSVLVADRISEAGRDILRDGGWGWLDRRGHLRVWSPGVRVEVPLDAAAGPRRSRATNPWTTVGLEVALAALLEPTEPVAARRIARRTGRSVGATHELIARFTELGLVGPSTRLPLLPELFWETAGHWPDDGWVRLPVPIEEVAARVGVDELTRVDERAATLGGARIPAAGDLPPRCYVRTAAGWRRARGLYEPDVDGAAHCWVRRSPVAWVPDNPDHPPDADHPWRVAHPMVCALRLAADPSRGAEVVDDWGIVPTGSGA
jgi:hypothetical protein